MNPMEFCWNNIKKELRKILSFDEMVANAGQAAVMMFERRKMSYTVRWREKLL
ncbi:MAG: hypothetical protein JRN19_01280 [Nitrososphaerota archaeon]|nr:hypothetical protein [Nitrososphaerota archaeon]MDG7048542.1 hypothetical protein [Nitrososphaerota archaeon]MDG7051073.1 hypothetical protein [Nitrososphaerota archaeon]